jgi:multiple sugar transport system substrate-binding protein
MFYNKEIFDKFAVSYPVNDMTWDQTIDLARRITRLQDGVQYIGWEPGFPDANAEVFSKPLVDVKTKKALVDTPEYHKVFAMMMKGWEIPGFGGDKNVTRYTPANFVKDKYVGIFVDWYNKFFLQLDPATEAGTAPDWDLVTVPNFPENMGKARHSSVQFLMIPQQSKHKEQALQLLQTVSTLDAQLLQGRNGRIPVLADPEIQKQFGKDTKTLANKHVENLFKNKTVADAPATIYDDEIIKILRNVATSLAKNKEDVNTALRNAQAEADKKVAEMDAQ